MGQEIDLLDQYPRSKRPIDERAKLVTDEHRRIARQFAFDYFDGDRLTGYGGYNYHPRFWQATVQRFRDHYRLAPNASVLDVGCGKGFMLHDFHELMPDLHVAGIDRISRYAIEDALAVGQTPTSLWAMPSRTAASGQVPSILIISINTIHNLPHGECRRKRSLREIERVCKSDAFITVDAWRNDDEQRRMLQWNLTAADVHERRRLEERVFADEGYTGDYCTGSIAE